MGPITDVFFIFYMVIKHKSANKSTTTAAMDKIRTALESLEVFCTFDSTEN
jgi:hypothetical protein